MGDIGGDKKKIMPPGKTQDVLCLFCCFSKKPSNCAEFSLKRVLKKNKKDPDFFLF